MLALNFEYSPFLDSLKFANDPIPTRQEWVEETMQLIPQFKFAWENESKKFLDELFKITGKTFLRKELTVTLVAWGVPPFSSPIVIGCRRFCKSYMRDMAQSSLDFVDLLFHELLHVFLDQDVIWKKSYITDKFAHHQELVREHLHLMMLQKLIYEQLGMVGRLDKIVQQYISKPGTPYEESWKLISGNEQLFKELKKDLQL